MGVARRRFAAISASHRLFAASGGRFTSQTTFVVNSSAMVTSATGCWPPGNSLVKKKITRVTSQCDKRCGSRCWVGLAFERPTRLRSNVSNCGHPQYHCRVWAKQPDYPDRDSPCRCAELPRSQPDSHYLFAPWRSATRSAKNRRTIRSLTFVAVVWVGLFSGSIASAQTFVMYQHLFRDGSRLPTVQAQLEIPGKTVNMYGWFLVNDVWGEALLWISKSIRPWLWASVSAGVETDEVPWRTNVSMWGGKGRLSTALRRRVRRVRVLVLT